MPSVNLPLSNNSAIIQAYILPSIHKLQQLTLQGIPHPQGQLVNLLVDSGASGTCIDPNFLQRLNLTPTSKVPVLTPSTNGIPVFIDSYDIQLLILHNYSSDAAQTVQTPIFNHHQSLRVTGNSMAGQNIDGLLGMDVLRHCLFAINGKVNSFTLWW
ncbi:aspartyl protease family protein [Acinetobacter ursingii]|uniref:aspartyl protease family protein n=1 Tax=Acinetobacter ursingii TaxID=108980 RepID=UPI00125086BD|nr:aspartyl protease family protein [Acinetobacter ursingii]